MNSWEKAAKRYFNKHKWPFYSYDINNCDDLRYNIDLLFNEYYNNNIHRFSGDNIVKDDIYKDFLKNDGFGYEIVNNLKYYIFSLIDEYLPEK
jgi:hypothetical protein